MNHDFTTSSSRVPTLLRRCGLMLGLGFAALVVLALTVVVVIPRAVHGQAMTVLTGSMTPTIPVGSIVLVRPVDPGTLHVGDIATYQKEPGKAVYITHRIAKIDASKTPAQFTFKGDANRGADLNPVVPQQIRGRVWFHVPYLGAIRDGLHGKGGITLVLTLILAGYAISQIGSGLGERRSTVGTRPNLALDRPLVVAEFRVARLRSHHGISPEEAATRASGLLVRKDETTCMVLVSSAHSELPKVLGALAELDAAEVRVCETGEICGHWRPVHADVRAEAVHVAG